MKKDESIQSRRRAMKSIASLAAITLAPAVIGRASAETFGPGAGHHRPPGHRPPGHGGSDGSDSGAWASGGTASMTADFPEDSIFETGQTCSVALTEALTMGPCYFTGNYQEDISEGQTGLPMMLCLQLIDQNCQPLAGYEVEVWHCNVDGLYSGDTTGSSDSSSFFRSYCTENDEEALASKWFRGTLVTDSSGRVNFRSCFPGWYASRAIHIHFKINKNNTRELVSQCGFDDDFCTTICTTHVDYVNRGEPDTLFRNDSIFTDGNTDQLFNYRQNNDGSLLVYKRIIVS
ncbi:dioxygenase family protein [Vibrio mangrovi]|uniref:Catechol 1,2-dioxygenase n=1 Tax=Vibrio mangrovi TaxID=474394 RepID=A0A1Y6IYN1_9VIBR|nr:intradiol ring-cleavage dioxygenase [Vibrio mangrovi]MDW6002342.1 hypothetical protein [Vibrio mangrovi]SMS02759.1 Catechol 1,2-dioxygenase [Vibrio mangrovi]